MDGINMVDMKSKEDKITKEWIHQCLMEYIGLHLDDMGDYFYRCWKEAKAAVDDTPDYDQWFEMTRAVGSVCDMIGEWWYESFRGKEKEFKEFMQEIDFSGYIDKFKEDFEVEIVWIHPPVGRDRLDIDVIML